MSPVHVLLHVLAYSTLASVVADLIGATSPGDGSKYHPYSPSRRVFELHTHTPTSGRFSRGNGSVPGDIGLSNFGDTQYYVNVVLGGEDFSLILDTGSPDIVVNTRGRNVQFKNQTDLIVTELYGSGDLQGNEVFAELRLGDFTVSSQAFINITTVSLRIPDTIMWTLTHPQTQLAPDGGMDGFHGTLGMTFDAGIIWGNLFKAYGEEAAHKLGRSLMSNILMENLTLSAYFDVLLSRTDPLGEAEDGLFLIGQHAPGYEHVANSPKLPQVGLKHWTVPLDGVVINGNPFKFKNSSVSTPVSDASPNPALAALDTGASFAHVPAELAGAIYSPIPGSYLVPSQNGSDSFWKVPCNSTANVTFIFGGQEFYVHPLDLIAWHPAQFTIPDTNVTVDITLCRGSFGPVTQTLPKFNEFDLLLGNSFLKNVYVSYNYGDDYDRRIMSNRSPYVQMVSTTNRETAWKDWHSMHSRTPMVSPPNPLPVIAGMSDDLNDPPTGEANPALALGLLEANPAISVVLSVVMLAMCIRRVKGKGVGPRHAPVRFRETVRVRADETRLKYSDGDI
ncbi:acid protease [Trametes meyenii]|nr:acid protease [Trametes meyenii]